MNIQQDEAQISLETIERIQQQTRRALAHGGAPFFMMIWGAVWLIGYLGNQYLEPDTAGKLWSGISLLGMVASFLVGWRISGKVRRPGYDTRIGLFWLAWMVYTSLFIWLAGVGPDVTRLSLLIAVSAMFGYVIMGLWLWKPLAWIGIFVTAIAVVSYLFLPDYVNLIMAWVGGGALFFSGLDIYRNWR